MPTVTEYTHLTMQTALRVSKIEQGTRVLVTTHIEENPRQSVWYIKEIAEFTLTLVHQNMQGVKSMRAGFVLPFGWVMLQEDPFNGKDCFSQSNPEMNIRVYE